MNYRILIIGGSGFIGTNLVEKFIRDNFEVLNIDKKVPINKSHIKYWEELDILHYDNLLKKLCDFNPDYVVHLAARTDLEGKNINDYSTNTVGVENILKAIQQLHNLKKIIIASSMLVCSLCYQPNGQFDYHPTTIYGESKVITEKTVWENQPHCDWAIIRPTSIWGPWFGYPSSYVRFFKMLINKQYFHIGDKSCTKTHGYVGNTVYQIEKLLLCDTPAKDNKIFYLGDYDPTNIEEWANEIADALHYKIMRIPYPIILFAALCGDILKKINVSFPMTSFRLHNMTIDNIVDLSNIMQVAPELPFSRIEGIRSTLEWLNKNTDITNILK
jgi:nucleoside-diphosphate-sugar epimerase